jgi:hypothetical protein
MLSIEYKLVLYCCRSKLSNSPVLTEIQLRNDMTELDKKAGSQFLN